MILSDRDIKRAIKKRLITIRPFHKENLQPASVDLHLGKHFLVYDNHKNSVIDPKKPLDSLMKRVRIHGDKPFVLHPGQFALGMIEEETGVSSGYVGRLEGKSSVGRMGLMIHVTAGFLDPGNCLKMTLELHNTATLPILLYHKMPIAQIAFEKLSSECANPYWKKGKYVGDKRPVASQMWKNFIKKNGK